MKIKITMVLLTVLLITISCTKLPIGHGSKEKEDDIKLTDSNYFFEGDYTKHALEIKIDSLEKRLAFLNEKGSGNQEKEYENTSKQLNETIAINASIADSESVFKRVPRGPIPTPRGPGVIDGDLNYVLMHNLDKLNLSVKTKEGKLIAKNTGELITLQNTLGLVQYQEISFVNSDYEGLVIVEISRIENNGQELNFAFEAYKKAGD